MVTRDIRPLVLLLLSEKSHAASLLLACKRALVVTDCVSLAAAFLADTLTPSFLLSEKSHAASLLLACKRARDAPTCYQLFSVSSGQVDFFFTNHCRCRLFAVLSGRVLCLFSCRERTLGVPRWETRANDVRSGDGKHKIYGTNTQCKFQPMQCPSVDGRFVIIVCIFSRSAQVHRPYDSSGQVSACRERTPGVPRWETRANDVRSVDGKS